MTFKQRNQLLVEMTDDVAALVLTNNFRQVQALSIAQRHAGTRLAEYRRFMSRMEADQHMNRALEGLPTDEALVERASRGQSLTRPELAVLLAYAKTHLKERLIASTIHADPVIAQAVFEEFPAVIRERYAAAVHKHRLFREIVATIVANDVVHHLGISSVVHLSEFVGGEPDEVVHAYYTTARCFAIREAYRNVEAFESVDGETRLDMLLQVTQLARRATRWFLRHRRTSLDVTALAAYFAPRITELVPLKASMMGASGRTRRNEQLERWIAAGVGEEAAESCANAASLVVMLPVIDAAEPRRVAPQDVGRVFATLNGVLGIDWLADQLAQLVPTSLWQALERDLVLDDLMTAHATLAAQINADTGVGEDGAAVDRWVASRPQFARAWRAALQSAQGVSSQDFSLLSMTCRKLGDLVRTLENRGLN